MHEQAQKEKAAGLALLPARYSVAAAMRKLVIILLPFVLIDLK
jgi:hypothetical protein